MKIGEWNYRSLEVSEVFINRGWLGNLHTIDNLYVCLLKLLVIAAKITILIVVKFRQIINELFSRIRKSRN
jgi:cell division protein FtsL